VHEITKFRQRLLNSSKKAQTFVMSLDEANWLLADIDQTIEEARVTAMQRAQDAEQHTMTSSQNIIMDGGTFIYNSGNSPLELPAGVLIPILPGLPGLPSDNGS
jgi:hypothetical protein